MEGFGVEAQAEDVGVEVVGSSAYVFHQSEGQGAEARQGIAAGKVVGHLCQCFAAQVGDGFGVG